MMELNPFPTPQEIERHVSAARALRARTIALWMRRGANTLGAAVARVLHRAGSHAAQGSSAAIERRIALRAD